MNETGRCRQRSSRRPRPDFLDDWDENDMTNDPRKLAPRPQPPAAARTDVPAKRLVALAVALLLAVGVITCVALATSGADDERIKAAQAKKDALEGSERALVKAAALNLSESLADLQASIDQMKPADLTAEQGAVTELRRVAIEIRGLARDILAKEPEYKRVLALYQAELKAAPGAFVPAAEVFEQMSEEEELKEFKERYKRLGRSLRDLAKVMERRAADLAGEEKEVAEAYRYVAAADRYLTSLCEWLGTYPSFASGLERQKQVQELRSFIQYFRQLDSALDKFNKKVTQPGAAAP
jgi:hypothetical protein